MSPEQAESLYEAMRGVRDWRDDNKSIALYFFAKSGMSNCQAFKEKMQANPDLAFDLVMGKEV